jgi:adhesin transport system outer membrane protein
MNKKYYGANLGWRPGDWLMPVPVIRGVARKALNIAIVCVLAGTVAAPRAQELDSDISLDERMHSEVFADSDILSNELLDLLGMDPSRKDTSGNVFPLNSNGNTATTPVIDGAILTLNDAVYQAGRQDPDLLADTAAFESARYVAKSSLGQYGPKIDVHAQKGRETSFSSLSDQPVELPRHMRTDTVIALRQPIFDMAAVAAYKRDLALRDAAQYRRQYTAENLMYDTISAYFDLVQSLLAMGLAQDYEQHMRTLSGYMEKRVAGGAASNADLERIKAVSLSAQRAMLDAKSGRDNALVQISRLTGLKPSSIAIPSHMVPVIPLTADEAVKAMDTQSAELQAARQQIAAAGFDKAGLKARFIPKVEIEAGMYRSVNPSGQIGETLDKRVMLVVSMNLLNGGSDRYLINAQSAKEEEARERYRSTYEHAQQRVRINYLALSGLRQQLDVARKEYAANAAVAKAFDLQLFAANRSLLDVLDTYQKLYQSKLTLGKLLISNTQVYYQVLKNISSINLPGGTEN